jgi:hypothetical protein
MGLGRKVQDFVGAGIHEDAAHRLAVTDIGMYECEAGLAFKIGERGTITGVGQFVDDGGFVSGSMCNPGEI